MLVHLPIPLNRHELGFLRSEMLVNFLDELIGQILHLAFKIV